MKKNSAEMLEKLRLLKIKNKPMKRIYLTESQLKRICEVNDIYNSQRNDEDYAILDKVFGHGFTLREMTKYNDFEDRVEYASEHLPEINSGKRRAVFALNDKYVLKMTLGDHRYQSKNEYDASLLMNTSSLMPRIYHEARDFSWAIVERARPLTDNDCQRILGLNIYADENSDGAIEPSLQGFQIWAETQSRQKSRQSRSKLSFIDRESYNFPLYAKLAATNPWFKEWMKLERSQRADTEYGVDLSLGGYDFRGENLGVVNRNGKDTIVLIDGGFVKPYDTRKLKSKFNIDSPGVENSKQKS